MSKVVFKPYSQGQLVLFPTNLDERIAKDSPVRLVDRIVNELDISELMRTYEKEGAPSYHPRMLLKVVFYAYMNNVYSCRKIAKAMDENIHYMWLSGDQHPSFSTINRFRSNHCKECVNELFSQVVMLLVEMGHISLDTVYVDGTKIESVANKYTFVWRKNVERHKGNLEKKIHSILSQIEEGIAQDNAAGAEEGFTPIDSEELRRRIKELNRQQSEDNPTKEQKKQIRELEKHEKKLQEYEKHLDILGNRNSYSKTDPSATFMRMKEDEMNNGQTKPGYNIQVGTENQFITNFGIYPNPGDTTTLSSFLCLYRARLGKLPGELCADAGYGSQENYKLLEDNNIEAFVKYNYFHKEQKNTFKNNPFLQDNLYYNEEKDFFVCPMGQHMNYAGSRKTVSGNGFVSEISLYGAQNCQACPLRGLCHKSKDNREISVNHTLREYKRKARERLTSPEGLEHRSKRPIEPEAVFGQVKFNKQYDRFRHKGFDKVNMDFAILVMAFNLQKLHNKIVKQGKKTDYTGESTEKTFIIVFLLVLLLKRINLPVEEEKNAA